ncbi:hypothetical protein N9L68_03495 [bacterium]|nr:hypothetical protein [bacterium]
MITEGRAQLGEGELEGLRRLATSGSWLDGFLFLVRSDPTCEYVVNTLKQARARGRRRTS